MSVKVVQDNKTDQQEQIMDRIMLTKAMNKNLLKK
jgi:hypothetical protein